MKTIKSYVVFMLVAVLVAFVSSCSKVPKYAKLISDDAAVVVSMDINKGVKNTGMDDNADLKNKLKKQIKDSGVSKKLSNMMCDIVDDPAKLGLDLRDPLLFSMTAKEKAVLVGAVHDAENFTEVLNQMAKENDTDKVRQKGDYWVYNNGSAVLVYNKDWFYLGDKKYDQDVDDYVNDVKDLFERDNAKGTMLESENMKAMCSADGFIQVLLQMKGMSDLPDMKEALNSVPDDIDMEDIGILFDFNIEKADLTLTAEVIAEKKETKEKMEQYVDYLRDINENMLQYCDMAGAGMFVNVDFQKAMEVSDISKALKLLDEPMRSDVKKVLEAIDGEGVLTCNGFNLVGNMPSVSAYCKVNDESAIKLLEKNMDSSMNSEGAHKYSFPISFLYGQPAVFTYFGYDNNMLYCMTGQKGASLKHANRPLTADYAKGKGFYAYLSARFVSNALDKVETPQAKACKSIANLFTYAEAYYETGTKCVLKLHAKNEDFVSAFIKTMTNVIEELQSAPGIIDDYDEADTIAVYDDDDDYAYADTVAYDY